MVLPETTSAHLSWGALRYEGVHKSVQLGTKVQTSMEMHAEWLSCYEFSR